MPRDPLDAPGGDSLPLGRLVAGHGVRGMARVKPFNPGSPTLRTSSEVWVADRSASTRRRMRVRECRPHQGLFLIRFEGIDSLDDLEPWIGGQIEVDRHVLPAPEEGEVYHHEVVGIEVRTTGGEPIGVVVEVMALPANDVWVVRDPAGAGADGKAAREWLIPAVAPIVTRIDLRERFALIDPIPGLLDT